MLIFNILGLFHNFLEQKYINYPFLWVGLLEIFLSLQKSKKGFFV